jgi:AbrB family looped-hinge helix DNA binding protein
MAACRRLTTTVSSKGRVMLPKAICDRHRWGAGTRLVVENTDDGVLLKAAPVFPPTRPEDVYGSLHWRGAPKSLAEMKAGIEAEVKRRRAGQRYY